jgi:hypothetical protein
VIEVIDEVLDAGERQLHPADVIGTVERRTQVVDGPGVGPDDRLGLVPVDEFAAARDHRVGEPLGPTDGPRWIRGASLFVISARR